MPLPIRAHVRFRRTAFRLTLLTAAVASIGGCDPTGPRLPEATFLATWAGDSWAGQASAVLRLSSDTLHIFGTQPVGPMPQTYVRIQIHFQGPGTYALGAGDAEFMRLLGGDVVTAAYGIADGSAGYLIIEESTATRVRGRVGFDAASLLPSAPYGSEARFEGTFDAPVSRTP